MKKYILIILEKFLKHICKKQDTITESLSAKKVNYACDFISEKEAQRILKRKPTWFWQMRKAGMLPSKIIEKSFYYSIDYLKTVLENSKNNKR